MSYSGKIPSQKSIDQAVIVHGLRIRSTPAEFACIIFETARQIDEMVEEENQRDRPAPWGRNAHGDVRG